ncbi:4a954df4-6f93-4993-af24-2716a631fcbb [Thermothielavioides terrestris]|nr:4a954df4-6f93-4993-af24-2716a631fcbb [Thermothielavioides terrestris]
MFFLIVI